MTCHHVSHLVRSSSQYDVRSVQYSRQQYAVNGWESGLSVCLSVHLCSIVRYSYIQVRVIPDYFDSVIFVVVVFSIDSEL
jgi:hypothetical protein